MGAKDQLRIDVRHQADRVILSLIGELDMATAPLLDRAIEIEDAGGKTMLVLDLQQLQFIDSTGLRSILTALERCRERRREFAITPGSQQVQRLLNIAGVAEHLPRIATADEAIA